VPQPGDARLEEIYGTSYYEPWQWEDKEVVQDFKARTFLHALRRAVPTAGDRLLDVGCAQGELAATASGLGLDVLGVDINADAIQRARERVPQARFACGEIEADVVGTDWDIVTMFDFIEHVRRPTETLSRAGAVMRQGGRLLVSTPRTGSLSHLLSGRYWPQYREEHLVLFSETGLRWALADAGFSVESVVPTTKYTTGAYLLGQVWGYTSPAGRRLAEHASRALRLRPLHAQLPMRFGEMTVLARKSE
jgi:SAM-dependent methyltransferase